PTRRTAKPGPTRVPARTRDRRRIPLATPGFTPTTRVVESRPTRIQRVSTEHAVSTLLAARQVSRMKPVSRPTTITTTCRTTPSEAAGWMSVAHSRFTSITRTTHNSRTRSRRSCRTDRTARSTWTGKRGSLTTTRLLTRRLAHYITCTGLRVTVQRSTCRSRTSTTRTDR